MHDIATPLIMGILLGGLYALIALGLSLVFGVMKLINVAHGDLVILGSYFAFFAMTVIGIDPIISLVIGMPVFFLLGFVIQKYLMSHSFGMSLEAPLIIAFGLSLIFQNFNQLMWTPMSRGLTTSYALNSFAIAGVRIPLAYTLDFIAAIIVMIALSVFLHKTYLGRAIIAASQNRKAAQLMGINTAFIFALTFAIAGATAAVAGVFLGMTFPFTPTSGIGFLIIAFGVIIIGGMGSMIGTFIGGMVLGLAQTLGGYFFGPAAQMLIAYIIVLVVLSIRPQGIFGR